MDPSANEGGTVWADPCGWAGVGTWPQSAHSYRTESSCAGGLFGKSAANPAPGSERMSGKRAAGIEK